MARAIAAMVVDDPDFPPPPAFAAIPDGADRTARIDHLADRMAYAVPDERHALADWSQAK
jgi:hypothetical protein